MSCGNGSVASPSAGLAETAAALRPNLNGDPVVYATKLAMQTLGRRVVDIDADCARLHGELADLVKATAPSMLDSPRCRHPHRRPVARRRRRQRRTDHLRGRLRPPLRGRPDPRLVGQDDPSPAQPRRQPPRQPRPVAHRVHPHELGPAHPRLRRTTHSSKDAPSPRSCASSSATSPARSTDTSPACSATIGVAGLTREMPDADGCLDNDLSARHSTFSGDTAWPDKSPPSNLEWPITGLPAPSPKLPLDKHKSIDMSGCGATRRRRSVPAFGAVCRSGPESARRVRRAGGRRLRSRR